MSMLFHPAVAWLAARQLLARRRSLSVFALMLFPIGLGIAFRLWGGTEPPAEFFMELAGTLVFAVVVPLIALLLGGAAFGSELEEGTAVYLLARPIPRHAILFGKAVVVLPVVAIASALTALGCGLAVMQGFDADGILLGTVLASAVGGAIYALLFMALGLVTRRGTIIGLLYLAVWEGMLGTMFAGTRLLSVRQYMLSLMDRMIADPELAAAPLTASTALWMAIVLTIASAALALRRLRNFELRGET